MAEAAGYMLNVSKRRRGQLLDALGWEETLAEAVPEFAHSRGAPLMCFVAFETGAITHLSSGSRGTRAGTGLRRLNLRDLSQLRKPVRHREIVSAVDQRMRSRVAARLATGGMLPPVTFRAVVDAVRRLSPASRPMLDRYSEDRRRRIARLPRQARSALAYQKEAIATALAIADIDRDALQRWNPPDEGAAARPASFLDGLPAVRAREDAMVAADMAHVPGFDLVRTTPYGAALFEGEGIRLTVVLANHLPLEQQLGGDLIYFNETYQSFIIVQYKAMEGTGRGPAFRLPNAQLTAELARMDSTLKTLHTCPRNTVREGFRLLENPFFLKLCSRLIFNPDDVRLVSGMYLPLDYWRLIESDSRLLGPRGGRQVTFGNVGRHLDNTEFISLVSKAWVGTTQSQSQILREVIREVIRSGRTLALAVETETKSRSRPLATRPSSGIS